jgi:hypothetical protein
VRSLRPQGFTVSVPQRRRAHRSVRESKSVLESIRGKDAKKIVQSGSVQISRRCYNKGGKERAHFSTLNRAALSGQDETGSQEGQWYRKRQVLTQAYIQTF